MTHRGELRGWSLRRLWPWARAYRRDVILMIITDVLALAAQMSVPLLIAAMIDGPIAERDVQGIWLYGAGMVGLGLVQTVLYVFRRRAMVAGLNIEHDLRISAYAHVQRMQSSFHDRLGSGQLIARTTHDLRVVSSFIAFVLPYLVSTAFTLVFVIIMLLRLHWGLGLVVLVAMVPMVLLSRMFRAQYESLAVAAGLRIDDLTTTAEESALGIRVIKSYGRRRMMQQQFVARASQLSEAEVAKLRLFASFDSVLLAYPILVLAVIVVGGAIAVSQEVLSLGAFVAFTAFYFRLLVPVTVAGQLLSQLQGAATAFGRVVEVLDSTPDVADPAQVVPLPSTPSLPVRFDQASFRFRDDTAPVLEEIDLEIRAGETMALVGATGSGKSALAALIPRLADVSGGRVLVGGVDVRDTSLAELRGSIGVAFEDATLFSVSVRDNLTLGRPGITDADIQKMINVTQADFVRDLPDGLETVIGEQGLSLSGGQRQRLALARALLGQPRILVLDDPMSALDVRTEEAIERQLRRVLADVTVIIVARRLSTALVADRVAVLEEGKITDVGTHPELMSRSSFYRWLMVGTGTQSELINDA